MAIAHIQDAEGAVYGCAEAVQHSHTRPHTPTDPEFMAALTAPLDSASGSRVCLLDTMILEPHAQGTWLHIPISPEVNLQTPIACVFQNNMNEPLHSQTRRVVKNLLLALPEQKGDTFAKDMAQLESFMLRGVSCLWPSWFQGMFQHKLVELVRPSKVVKAYPHEMRLNMLASRASKPLPVVDEMNQPIPTSDIEAGSFVRASLRVTGIWCSADRWGLKYAVEQLTLVRSMGALGGPP